MNSLNIFHQNIQCLSSRIDSLLIVIDELKPDIIILTEHKLTKNEILNFNICGYKLASYYVRKINEGGGVLIMVSNNIDFTNNVNKSIEFLNIDKLFESCVIELKLNNTKIIIGGIYRTPSRNIESFLFNLDKLLSFLTKKSGNICIGGDFNIDILTQDNRKQDFINILLSHNMYYTINIPTRVTESSETAIDNFITNIDRKNVNVECIVTALSDHDGQIITLNNLIKLNKSHSIQLTEFKRIFSKANIQQFLYDLGQEDWYKLYNITVENKFTYFYNIFKYYFNINFPLIKSRHKPLKNNWIDEKIRQERHKLVNSTKALRKNKNQHAKLIIKRHKRYYKKLIFQKKRNYFNNKIRNCDNVTRTAWQLVNSELGRGREYSLTKIVLKVGNKIVDDPNNVANTLNNYYADMVEKCIIPKLTKSRFCNSNLMSPVSQQKFQFRTISDKQLIEIIDSLKNKWSAGYDGIPTKILKDAKLLLLKPLLHVINACLISGIYPKELKKSKIIPIFKKGDTKEISNYRPISIQPSLSKVFEKCMLIQLVNYFEVHNFLDNEQHGFRQNKSTITAIISYIETIIDKLEKGEHVVTTFLDMSKAFDSVSHSLLIEKLNSYGISGKELTLIKSYLEDRQQYVETKHICGNSVVITNSMTRGVAYSVPQGSVLGPFLFLCYLGGLPDCISKLGINNKLCIFADDVNLTVSNKNYDKVLSDSSLAKDKLNSYLNDLNLLLNEDKTICMKFSCKDLVPANNITNLQFLCLKFSEKTSFLGILVDNHLNWTSHVEKVCSKVSSGIFALKRLTPFCNFDTVKCTYFSLIHSHIAYGIEVYGATTIFNMNKILHLQKVAIRTMLKLDNKAHCKQHFSELKIMTVYSLYIYKTILLIKNNEHILLRQKDNHRYDTRNKLNFQLFKHSKMIFEKKPSYAGIRFINHLPNKIKKENNYNIFKKMLKSFLIEKALYTIQEYFMN